MKVELDAALQHLQIWLWTFHLASVFPTFTYESQAFGLHGVDFKK